MEGCGLSEEELSSSSSLRSFTWEDSSEQVKPKLVYVVARCESLEQQPNLCKSLSAARWAQGSGRAAGPLGATVRWAVLPVPARIPPAPHSAEQPARVSQASPRAGLTAKQRKPDQGLFRFFKSDAFQLSRLQSASIPHRGLKGNATSCPYLPEDTGEREDLVTLPQGSL
ncbi:hypothetical protein P4O66_008415 [Electrophorus voltai]|uniref:Uncharacterized protein n=1 Tax=Electrophorus voltai TaxID=2609070 RepID=A0AAD8ZDF6_9TELE|nr:hypothetical protein P4O66_008415 [Electrophorus voltai]